MPLVQDAAAAGRLRSMKRTATALLGVAAALYVVSLNFGGPAIGFLRAGAEAAMVGGLADWFAVTALFRHPLGVPIPHTALVPRKKDELATKLGEFVTGHFLTREVVTEQVAVARIVPKVGGWLAEPVNADRLAREVAYNAGALLDALDDDAVVEYVLELLRRDVARRSYAPVLGRILEQALAGGTQEPLVEIFARRGHGYLRAHREELIPELKQVADKKWYGWLLATDRRIRGVLDALAETLEEVEHDPAHGLRVWLDGLLASLATELQTDPVTAAKIDALATRLLDDPRAQAVLHEVVTDAMVSVRESLTDADGTVQTRISLLIQQVGRRAGTDELFRKRIETVLEAVVGHAVERYGSELTELIRRQVADWDASSASRNIELAVGRDLQFIRINGTFVGALAGLAIHALTVAV
ncbi:MAG TPA: DUF445 domain-containing protein [Mycobacteriales bacterium]|jgi:uncharacterized membrane-anchored protein YjiN (DUF445 family)|nr:DUF445 domain-containing protein [Mycobacteriales bacterium]